MMLCTVALFNVQNVDKEKKQKVDFTKLSRDINVNLVEMRQLRDNEKMKKI